MFQKTLYRNLSADIKERIMRCYIFLLLLYGIEASTFKRDNLKKLSFRMGLYRRMLHIAWTENVEKVTVPGCNYEKEKIPDI